MITNMNYTPANPPPQQEQASGIASVLTGRRKAIILGSIALLAFGYFAFTAFQAATSFYLSVDELVERGPVAGETYVQVKGSLKPFTFARESDTSLLAHFQLEEGGAVVDATYNGVLPDLFFNPHSEIVLGGEYTAEGVLVVERDSLLIKCPSKYEALEVENPTKSIPGALET
jgi:cytochrome c-type biogenesis protein CcmE